MLVSVKCCFTFQPDHQRHFELQLSASFGDAVGNDGTINNAPKDVDQDGFNLWKKTIDKKELNQQ